MRRTPAWSSAPASSATAWVMPVVMTIRFGHAVAQLVLELSAQRHGAVPVEDDEEIEAETIDARSHLERTFSAWS
jgi:hypothetical protein